MQCDLRWLASASTSAFYAAAAIDGDAVYPRALIGNGPIGRWLFTPEVRERAAAFVDAGHSWQAVKVLK